jgi:hypothetical protein
MTRTVPLPTPTALLSLLASLALGVALPASAVGQELPTPGSVIGFEPGEDHKLADYGQLTAYYQALADASDRVLFTEMGTTTRGRPMHLMFVSSPTNLARLDEIRETSRQLSLARNLTEAQARRLARDGKAVVWIDSGLHSTEVAHAQHVPHLAHHLASDGSEETLRILDNVVLLLMPVMNPDGHEIVVDWYRRNLGTPFETTSPPDIYHEYVGHDNNRDWFMLLQDESRHVARVLYEDWFPQIVFNHHQTGPFPARITLPPFAEPVNPHIHPGVVRGVNLIGTHMADRFQEQGQPGVLSYTAYDMWWNGGMRTAPYFHNQLGILVEVQHNSPTPRCVDPEDLPAEFGRRDRILSSTEPSIFYPEPWPGGCMTLMESVQYHLTASMAVLDVASLRSERFLYNIYRMGREQIEAGEAGGPYAYLVPAVQWDRPEAVEMLNVLRRGGVEVHEATSSFQAGGRTFPAGTWILYTAQAFRAHLMDLMEPQVYPERRLYPGGPPEPPYDLAGWTLPIQMGVEVVRVEEPFRASAREVTDRVGMPPGSVAGRGGYGWLLSPRSNHGVLAVNRLLAEGIPVSRASAAWSESGTRHEAGTWVIGAGSGAEDRMRELALELGLDFQAVERPPEVGLHPVSRPRLGVYRAWTANIPEGWLRWILDTYGFDYETLYDADVRGGDLSRFDVILLPAQDPEALLHGNLPGTMPEEYVGGLGLAGIAALKQFVEDGGTLVALDGAGDVVMDQFGLPIRSTVRGVPDQEFFIPGSLLRIRVRPDHPLTWGLPEKTSGTFVTRRGSQSRGFRILSSARAGDQAAPAHPAEAFVWWGDGSDLLLSGWALGEDRHLAGAPAGVRMKVGEGNVVLLGLRAGFRGQPRATFKLLFNGIYAGATEGALVSPAMATEREP